MRYNFNDESTRRRAREPFELHTRIEALKSNINDLHQDIEDLTMDVGMLQTALRAFTAIENDKFHGETATELLADVRGSTHLKVNLDSNAGHALGLTMKQLISHPVATYHHVIGILALSFQARENRLIDTRTYLLQSMERLKKMEDKLANHLE